MPDWSRLLRAAAKDRPLAIRAETFVQKFPTSSSPVRLICGDEEEYVVKSMHAGRMIVTEQVVGRLGETCGAPVGLPALIDVPAGLIDAEPEMAHMTPGLAHGSRWIPGCTHGGFDHMAANRSRFAELALLYGWTLASDHQFIYRNDAPHLVYSVDHGGFFAGSTGWTAESLRGAPAAAPDVQIVANVGLQDEDLHEAQDRLADVDDEGVAYAVAVPPDEWGMSEDERVALAQYLATRRDTLFGVADDTEEGAA
jgi:hypothetical protein